MSLNNNLLENYFDLLYSKTNRSYIYRGVDIGSVSATFFAGKELNNADLISQLTQQNVSLIVDSKLSSIRKLSFFYSLWVFTKDLLKWCLSICSLNHNDYQCELYFFIANKKFIVFFKEIQNVLDEKNIKSGYIFWDNNEIPNGFTYPKIVLKQSLPILFHQLNKDNFLLFSHVDRLDRISRKISNSKVLIPEGCQPSMHIMGLLGKKYKFETICVQWGFFGKSAVKPGWRNMPYDKFLVWGDLFKQQFSRYNSLNIIVSGHPNLDIHKIGVTKNSVLICVQKELGEHITKNDVVNFLTHSFSLIKRLSNINFILRTHPDLPWKDLPVHPQISLPNLVVHDYDKYSLNESFINSQICIGISSTTVFESVGLGCYPVFLRANTLPLLVHSVLSEYSGMQHVFNFSEIEEFIVNFNYANVANQIFKLKQVLFSKNTLKDEIFNNNMYNTP